MGKERCLAKMLIITRNSRENVRVSSVRSWFTSHVNGRIHLCVWHAMSCMHWQCLCTPTLDEMSFLCRTCFTGFILLFQSRPKPVNCSDIPTSQRWTHPWNWLSRNAISTRLSFFCYRSLKGNSSAFFELYLDIHKIPCHPFVSKTALQFFQE